MNKLFNSSKTAFFIGLALLLMQVCSVQTCAA